MSLVQPGEMGYSAPGHYVSMKNADYCAFPPSEYRKAVAKVDNASRHARPAGKISISGNSGYREEYRQWDVSEYQGSHAHGDKNSHDARTLKDPGHASKDHFKSLKEIDYRNFGPDEYRRTWKEADGCRGEQRYPRHVGPEFFVTQSRATYASYDPKVYKDALDHGAGGAFDLSGKVAAAAHNYRPSWSSGDPREQYESTARSTYRQHDRSEYLAKKADLESQRQHYVVKRVGEEHFQSSSRRDYCQEQHDQQK